MTPEQIAELPTRDLVALIVAYIRAPPEEERPSSLERMHEEVATRTTTQQTNGTLTKTIKQ